MKTTHIILAAIIAATSAVQAATAEHKLPAPLPEFKTPEQLVVWRKEMAEKAKAADALAAKQANSALPISYSTLAEGSSVFYTGKPYVQETGSYSFLFRQFDPEHCRWTTIDPSGFPDGANNSVYASCPTVEFDLRGLAAKSVITCLNDALEHWSSNAGGARLQWVGKRNVGRSVEPVCGRARARLAGPDVSGGMVERPEGDAGV